MGIKVTFVEENGTVKVEEGKPGQSLMELGRQNGIAGILGDCGGACACATCHVYVDPEWVEKTGKPDEVESEMLDMVSAVLKDNSRLGCQIKLRDDLDGLKVEVAPHI